MEEEHHFVRLQEGVESCWCQVLLLLPAVNEHIYDAESFSKKSHIIKNWINSHPERDEAPPFEINILRQYKDSLSSQVGEAIAILLTKDTLLNSKNKYIQDLLSPR